MRWTLTLLLFLAACGDDDATPPDAAPDAPGSCAVLGAKQAMPGDAVGTFSDVAAPFFTANCTRCHSTAKVGTDRNGAPVGYDWDMESAVRNNLLLIRDMVGVKQQMPPSGQKPSCADRLKLVRWIDGGAP